MSNIWHSLRCWNLGNLLFTLSLQHCSLQPENSANKNVNLFFSSFPLFLRIGGRKFTKVQKFKWKAMKCSRREQRKKMDYPRKKWKLYVWKMWIVEALGIQIHETQGLQSVAIDETSCSVFSHSREQILQRCIRVGHKSKPGNCRAAKKKICSLL